MRTLLAAVVAFVPAVALAEGPMTSDIIAKVQHRLQHSRHYEVGPVTGEFGDSTRAALWYFQQENNLPTTGEPDVRTMAALGLARSIGLPDGPETVRRPEGAAGGGTFGTSLHRQ